MEKEVGRVECEKYSHTIEQYVRPDRICLKVLTVNFCSPQIFMLPFTKSALWDRVPINVKGVNISCPIYFAVSNLWGGTAEAKGGDQGDMITCLSLQKSAKPVGFKTFGSLGCHLYSVPFILG